MKASRRDFIKKTTLITTGIGLGTGPAWTKNILTANDRINVGLIGCRNQGFGVLKNFLQTGQINCLGLCDIDQNILDEKLAE
ncbi:MAG: twin-arginine translocation signal domain-containing protein, partial [Anditalea sp.]